MFRSAVWASLAVAVVGGCFSNRDADVVGNARPDDGRGAGGLDSDAGDAEGPDGSTGASGGGGAAGAAGSAGGGGSGGAAGSAGSSGSGGSSGSAGAAGDAGGSACSVCNACVACDPLHPQQPSAGYNPCCGWSTCVSDPLDGGGNSRCENQVTTGDVGAACTEDRDCRPGLGCAPTAPKTCKPWGFVKNGNADCPQVGSICKAVDRYAGAKTVGFEQLCLCEPAVVDGGANPSCNPVNPPNPNGGWTACAPGATCITGVNLAGC
jgi:hypothetical protein